MQPAPRAGGSPAARREPERREQHPALRRERARAAVPRRSVAARREREGAGMTGVALSGSDAPEPQSRSASRE